MAKVTLKINIDLPGLRKELEDVLGEIKSKLAEVGELQIDAETSDAINAVDDVTESVEKTDVAAKSTTESFSEWGMIVTGLNQAIELIEKTIDVITKPIEDAGQFEQYEAALTVMLRSAEKAKQRLSELVEFAANTPFELPQVVEAGNQLQAIGEYSEETLTMLGDLASASGKSFGQVLNAYAKMASGQKGIAIDMFRDLLVTTDDWVKATGKQLGKNGSLQATVEEMAEALPRIIEEKGFSGMMEVQSKTLNGMVSNFEDGLGQLSTKVGQLLLPATKQIVSLGNQFVSSMIPVENEINNVREKADLQRFSFELLVSQYERLRTKANKTNIEQQEFSRIISELHGKYPKLLGNLDLQKGKLEDVRDAFKQVRTEIEKNIIIEIRKAEIVEIQKLIETKKDLISTTQLEIDKDNARLQQMKNSTISDRTKVERDLANTRSNISIPIIKKESDVIKESIITYKERIDQLNLERDALEKQKNLIYDKLPLDINEINNTNQKNDITKSLTSTRYKEINAKAKGLESSIKINKQLAASELKYTKTVKDEEEKRINAWKAERDAKRELLQETIAVGIASAQAEENLSKQLGNIARNSIKRIIAEGIAYQLRSVFMSIPFPFSVIAAAAVAETIGALVDSLLPKFGEGGMVRGKKHKDGGTNINAEEGEYIFDSATVDKEPHNFVKLHRMLKSGDITLGQVLNPAVKHTSGIDTEIIPRLSNLSLEVAPQIRNQDIEKNNILTEILSEIKELRTEGIELELKVEKIEERIEGAVLYRILEIQKKFESKRIAS